MAITICITLVSLVMLISIIWTEKCMQSAKNASFLDINIELVFSKNRA